MAEDAGAEENPRSMRGAEEEGMRVMVAFREGSSPVVPRTGRVPRRARGDPRREQRNIASIPRTTCRNPGVDRGFEGESAGKYPVKGDREEEEEEEDGERNARARVGGPTKQMERKDE